MTLMNTGKGSSWSTRIRLEREKRAWTQEHLAEESGLSVRTVQRVESGADPSKETLRALANVFDMPDLPYLNTGMRKDYPAPWSVELKIISAVVTILLMTVSVLLNNWFSIFPLALLIGTLMFSIHGYSIRDEKLLIHRLGWATKRNLSELMKCSVLPNAMMGSMRVFGNGGLYGYSGVYRNAILGTYRAFATRRENCLVLQFGEKHVVITPDEPLEMKQALEEFIGESHSGR
jgi:transcriptional regulator with XRE-family HTH domain